VSADTMNLREILTNYRDHDGIGWPAMFAFLRTYEPRKIANLTVDIARNGIREPIYLGDGVVLDGLHAGSRVGGVGAAVDDHDAHPLAWSSSAVIPEPRAALRRRRHAQHWRVPILADDGMMLSGVSSWPRLQCVWRAWRAAGPIPRRVFSALVTCSR
jgi:hypothetical protein